MFGWLKRSVSSGVTTGQTGGQRSASPEPVLDSSELKKRGNALLADHRLVEAADCYRRAALADPQDADARVNLGHALREQRLFEQSEVPLRQAVSLAPASIDALYLLAATLREMGQSEPAIEHFRRALALQPDFSICRRDLCRALLDVGRMAQAREVVDAGVALNPFDADLLHDLGNLHAMVKAFDDAVATFEKALAIRPRDAGVLTNLGFVLHKQGKIDAALELQQQALAIEPDLAEAHFNLGAAMQSRGRLADAEHSFRRALTLKAGYIDPLVNLGAVLQAQGRFDAAAETLRAALALAPENFEAHNNLAAVLLDLGRSDEAIAHLEAALLANPDSPQVRCNLGAAFQRLGRLDDAANNYRIAVDLDPEFLDARSNLLFVLSFLPGCSPADYLSEARRYGAKVAARAVPYTAWPAKRAAPLRVGLVSGDLKAHPVGYFIEGLLRCIDSASFELIAYPTQPREDELTARVKPAFAGWTPLYGLSDAEAARRIHGDGIDILIDLAGHSAHNRLPVFAWRPAPVQLSWLGYFASTGVPGIDWLIADPVSVPERHRHHFSEAICYVADTRLCFTPPHESTAFAVAPLPALRSGFLTFGCFQVSSKINAGVLAAWAQIFRALPDARLRLQNQEMSSPLAKESLLARLGAVGIAADRVTLVGGTPRNEYLAAHAEVDIILDTFPYPGGTTTCEALWMGVPTLTLAGESLLARQGASLLACAGLVEWVAGDAEDYVDRALDHAGRLDELAQLRQGLRERVLASPLFNAPRFARQLEAALQSLWSRRWPGENQSI